MVAISLMREIECVGIMDVFPPACVVSREEQEMVCEEEGGRGLRRFGEVATSV